MRVLLNRLGLFSFLAERFMLSKSQIQPTNVGASCEEAKAREYVVYYMIRYSTFQAAQASLNPETLKPCANLSTQPCRNSKMAVVLSKSETSSVRATHRELRLHLEALSAN